ncbi:MAG: NACHT domain-containing protein, partial [Anaerolineae bacterium]
MQKEHEKERDDQRFTIQGRESRESALAAISRHPQLVLLGQPGSGKSTLVNFVTYCLAGEGLGDTSINLSKLAELGWQLPALLPLRVILREYAARGLPEEQGLWDYLVSELAAGKLGGYQSELQQRLNKRGGILLLDGLDEVPQAHQRREQLGQAIIDFARDFPKVRIVVTSRPYAYDTDWALPNFKRADLLDFNPDQINKYIESWYTVTGELDPDLPRQLADQYAEQLKREVSSNPNLADLAPRPLLLALMVSLHRWHHGGGLPEKREELYDQSVDLLLDLWQRPKQLYDQRGNQTRKETSALVELGIGRDVLRNELSRVAFEAHRDQPDLTGTAKISGAKLAGYLHEVPGRKPDVSLDRIIEYVRDRAGLLEEEGGDREGRHFYSFPHRTFQEYLAACHLLKQGTFPRELVKRAREQPERWRETVLLAAGRASRTSDAQVWQLVQALCPHPLPDDVSTVPAADWWGAFLAGRVLWDVQLFTVEEDETYLKDSLDQVRDWLAALIAQAALPPLDRALAAEVPDRLGWLPKDLHRWVCCTQCGDDGRDLLVMRYPVTNVQFARFIEAGGYEDGACWQAGRGRYDRDRPAYWDHAAFGRERRGYPVVGVSWYQAAAYAAWLTGLLERAGNGESLPEAENKLVANLVAAGATEVRLPTESEWVRAAGGESGARYP